MSPIKSIISLSPPPPPTFLNFSSQSNKSFIAPHIRRVRHVERIFLNKIGTTFEIDRHFL